MWPALGFAKFMFNFLTLQKGLHGLQVFRTDESNRERRNYVDTEVREVFARPDISVLWGRFVTNELLQKCPTKEKEWEIRN